MTSINRNQHYLPAAVIGGFSLDTANRLRERTVWVRRRGVSRTFRERAENLGYRCNLYTLTGRMGDPHLDPGIIDRAWGSYERRLPDAITMLAVPTARPLAARLWFESLVRFVAGLFVRGPEFNRWFESRPLITAVKDFYGPSGFADNTNLVRLFEMQRLIYPVVTARWAAVHLPPNIMDPTIAVTSDVGHCLMRHREGGPGYAIPLRPDTVLVLHKGQGDLWVRWTGDEWVVDGIKHTTTFPRDIANFNEAMAATATEVYGATATVVDERASGSTTFTLLLPCMVPVRVG